MSLTDRVKAKAQATAKIATEGSCKTCKILLSLPEEERAELQALLDQARAERSLHWTKQTVSFASIADVLVEDYGPDAPTANSVREHSKNGHLKR